jgi:hypothetical protein
MVSLVGIASPRLHVILRYLLRWCWYSHFACKSFLKRWQLFCRDCPRPWLVHDKTVADTTSVDCLLSVVKAGISSFSDRIVLVCNVIHNVWRILQFRLVELKEVQGCWKVINNHLIYHLFNDGWAALEVLPCIWAGHFEHRIPRS